MALKQKILLLEFRFRIYFVSLNNLDILLNKYSIVINGRARVWRRSYNKKSKNNKMPLNLARFLSDPRLYHLLLYCMNSPKCWCAYCEIITRYRAVWAVPDHCLFVAFLYVYFKPFCDKVINRNICMHHYPIMFLLDKAWRNHY